ncbi:MAG: hypothetical protein IPI66_09970 [Chitinophagaceae bacterium]|nr:hypothetical protein [Chitinophagaceae bacterium]
MKKYSLIAFLLFPALLHAQSVSVNNDGSQPDNTAMLDIKSNSKGLLMPRLTSLERSNIASPAVGLTVFDINTYGYWIFRGDVNGGWAELQHSYQKNWDISGANIFNMNSGNVGIGTNSPGEKLAINASNPAIQLLNAGTAKGFLQVNNNDLKLGTYGTNATGNLVLSTKAVDRMTFDENGNIGIGTATSASALTINGTNPVLQIRTGDVNKGFLQVLTNDLKIGTKSTNTTGNLVFQTKALDRMMINENGWVGIGTTAPSSMLTLNSTNPILQLQNAGTDKGFIQLVDNDIKIGTNLSNATGKFIVRTSGSDRFYVSENGNVGVGVASSFYKFDVNGDTRVQGDLSVVQEVNSAGINLSAVSPIIEFNHTGGTSTFGNVGFGGNIGNDFIIGKGFNGGQLILDGSIGSSTKRFYLNKVNQFNMGTGNYASGYTLSVEGKVIATEFTTSPVANWPDYVFENNYALMPLSDVKAYINKHKHLPNIPAATELEKSGVPLGDITRKLMEKVEELTLYILELKDQLDAVKRSN